MQAKPMMFDVMLSSDIFSHIKCMYILKNQKRIWKDYMSYLKY